MRFRTIPRPLTQTNNDLDRVMRQNQPPLLTQQAMLGLLHLDEPNRDGKSLADRFLGSDNILDKICPPSNESMYVVKQTLVLIGQLLSRLAEGNETDYQREVATNLVAVAEKQIVREGDVCPIAAQLYLNIGETRPEMVNRQIYERLALEAGLRSVMALLERVVKLGGRVEIVEVRRKTRD